MYPNYIVPDYAFKYTALWTKEYMPNSTFIVDDITGGTVESYGRGTIIPFSIRIEDIYEPQNNSWIFTQVEMLIINKNISIFYPDISSTKYLSYDQHFDRIFDSSILVIYENANITESP
jgi:hypothetical protein